MKSDRELPGEFLDLVDLYCSDLLGEDELRRLEAILGADERARRYFVEYFHHHTEMHFAVRARRAADVVLAELSSSGKARERSPKARARRPWLSTRGWIGLAAGLLLALVLGGAFRIGGRMAAWRLSSGGAAKSSNANIAWLTNAQDCQWTDKDEEPGRDMQPGKRLRLERGLAEIEFDRGARVILQGPAGLELVSAKSTRLLYGTLTARVPVAARGFTVLSPRGEVVDLGTEFGLSVDPGGATTVKVFTGLVEAFPLTGGGVAIHQDETAQINGRTVALEPKGSDKHAVTYVRAIVPPPIVAPRSVQLDFARPVPGTIQDRQGLGIGLTQRLPGTGSALPRHDPNLRLRTEERALELTTTRSDLNTGELLATGEYFGFRLADLGFTGKEDFEISATFPNIPGLQVVGQFGLYIGAGHDTNIRGGLIRRPDPDSYRLFLVNNSLGVDHDIYEVGLMTTGDDLRLTLRRVGGRYSLRVHNLKLHSSSTLEIVQPAYLDDEKNLYAGLFGANTQSDHRKTLTIRDVKVTVWTTKAEPSKMVDTAARRGEPRRPLAMKAG
jgi:hypothetical protein